MTNLALGKAICAEPAGLALPQHWSHVIEIAYMVRVDYVTSFYSARTSVIPASGGETAPGAGSIGVSDSEQ